MQNKANVNLDNLISTPAPSSLQGVCKSSRDQLCKTKPISSMPNSTRPFVLEGIKSRVGTCATRKNEPSSPDRMARADAFAAHAETTPSQVDCPETVWLLEWANLKCCLYAEKEPVL